MDRCGGHLILLVGSNPLPNYLAACALRPERVLLVYSKKTKQPKDRLEAALRERLGVEIPEGPAGSRCVADATDASAVEEECRDLPADARLNYTGGTKIMATHARLAFQEAGGSPAHASYVDGALGIVRFDDGYPLPLPDDCLDLDVVLKLHGLELLSQWEAQEVQEGEPCERDAEAIADAALDNPELPEQLYRWTKDDAGKRKKREDARNHPLHASDLGLALPDPIPGDGWTRDQFKRWLHFLGGGWLDVSVAAQVKAALPDAAVHAAVHVRRHNEREFEVALRARQLGGDIASAALVCFLDGAAVDEVRRDIESVWDQPNLPEIFGLSHLREWRAGHRQSRPSSAQVATRLSPSTRTWPAVHGLAGTCCLRKHPVLTPLETPQTKSAGEAL